MSADVLFVSKKLNCPFHFPFISFRMLLNFGYHTQWSSRVTHAVNEHVKLLRTNSLLGCCRIDMLRRLLLNYIIHFSWTWWMTFNLESYWTKLLVSIVVVQLLNSFIFVLGNPFLWPTKVFKNHGAAAGASMTHSHSQIMGIPVIPPSVTARLSCMKEIFDLTGKCSVCDLQSNKDLMINGSTHFFAIAPFAASYAFEIWIVPREHSTYFHELDRAKVTSFLLGYIMFVLAYSTFSLVWIGIWSLLLFCTRKIFHTTDICIDTV